MFVVWERIYWRTDNPIAKLLVTLTTKPAVAVSIPVKCKHFYDEYKFLFLNTGCLYVFEFILIYIHISMYFFPLFIRHSSSFVYFEAIIFRYFYHYFYLFFNVLNPVLVHQNWIQRTDRLHCYWLFSYWHGPRTLVGNAGQPSETSGPVVPSQQESTIQHHLAD